MRTVRACTFFTLVALTGYACDDFDHFGRHTAAEPERRIILTPDGGDRSAAAGSDAGVAPPAVDGAAASPAVDAAAPPAPGTCGNALETQVFKLTNLERAAQGLPPYRCDAKATAVARSYSALMCSAGHFSHKGLDGTMPWDRMKQAGIVFSTAGENIAAGQSSAQAVMSSWMQSPGHRSNILSAKFTHLGVGYVRCDKGAGHYWTQNFFR